MNFKPLEPNGRMMPGAQLGFTVHMNSKNSEHGSLGISIHSDVMRKMKWKADEWLRLDADMKAGMGRLVAVMGKSKAARQVKATTSGRGFWMLPWSGAVKDAFPLPDGMTELEIADMSSSDGLIFNLPSKKGGAA